MSSEFIPPSGTTHWALGNYGLSACGILASEVLVLVSDITKLSCISCLTFASRQGLISKCSQCDRLWWDSSLRDLHEYSHED